MTEQSADHRSSEKNEARTALAEYPFGPLSGSLLYDDVAGGKKLS